MLLKLLQEIETQATNPGREMLLDGIIEGNDHALLCVLENQADFESDDIFDDEFFSLFLALAAGMAEKRTLYILKDWGFDMDSHLILNYEYGNRGTVGEWAAAFLPVERLHTLQNWGMLEPYESHQKSKSIHYRPDEITADQKAMILGDAEHFDYWFYQWELVDRELSDKHIGQFFEEGQQNKLYSKRKIEAPAFIDQLCRIRKQTERPKKDKDVYPDFWPKPQEISRRLKLLMSSFYSHWWYGDAAPLENVTQDPPQGTADFLHYFCTWAMHQVQAPFKEPVEIQACHNQHFEWTKALIQNGAPLTREDHPLELARLLITHSSYHSTAYDTLLAWEKRVEKENPTLLSEFFNLSFNQDYLEFFLINKRSHLQHWIEKGLPVNRVNQQGETLDYCLLKEIASDFSGNLKYNDFELWIEIRSQLETKHLEQFNNIPEEVRCITQENELNKLLKNTGARKRLLERLELKNQTPLVTERKAPVRRI